MNIALNQLQKNLPIFCVEHKIKCRINIQISHELVSMFINFIYSSAEFTDLPDIDASIRGSYEPIFLLKKKISWKFFFIKMKSPNFHSEEIWQYSIRIRQNQRGKILRKISKHIWILAHPNKRNQVRHIFASFVRIFYHPDFCPSGEHTRYHCDGVCLFSNNKWRHEGKGRKTISFMQI